MTLLKHQVSPAGPDLPLPKDETLPHTYDPVCVGFSLSGECPELADSGHQKRHILSESNVRFAVKRTFSVVPSAVPSRVPLVTFFHINDV